VLQLDRPVEPEVEIRKLDPVEEARKAAMSELAGALFDLTEESVDGSQDSVRGLQAITAGAGGASNQDNRPGLVYHLRQAIDFQTLDQYEEATAELEAVLSLGLEIPAVFFNLGWLHAKTGRLESGLRLLQRAVSHHSYTLGGRLVLGGLFRERDRLRDASLEYLEALRVADSAVVPPEQASILSQMYDPLIEAYLSSASDQDHVQLCSNIHELLMRPDWRTNLANARRELPSQGDATPLPLAEMLTEAQSGQIVGALTSIHQYARSGHMRVAMDEAYRALDYAPTYLPLHALMGDLLLRQDRVDWAVAKYTIVARAYGSRGESRRSEDMYRKIVNLAPMDLDARSSLINELNNGGDIDAALEEYVQLAEVYLRLAEMETARAVYAKALDLAQHSNAGRAWAVRILHYMADIDMQRLDWRQAQKIYEQIRQIDPGDQSARTNLIDLSLRMGQERQAMGEVDQYTAFLRQNGKMGDALQVLDELSATHADNPVILERLAQLYQHLGETEVAVKLWDRVGELYLDSGDDTGAIRVLNAIIALNPPDVDEYRRLYQELKSKK
jgi:tetratricopeptide (TPR) repeat protein